MASPHVNIVVQKNSGSVEVFAPGKIALAVFKSSQASSNPLSAGEGRLLGSKVSQSVQQLIISGGGIDSTSIQRAIKVDQEWIQDRVISLLSEFGYVQLSNEYSLYRQARASVRQQKKQDTQFMYSISGDKVELRLWKEKFTAFLEQLGVFIGVDDFFEQLRAERSTTWESWITLHCELLLDPNFYEIQRLRAVNAVHYQLLSNKILGLNRIWHSADILEEKIKKHIYDIAIAFVRRWELPFTAQEVLIIVAVADLKQDMTLSVPAQQLFMSAMDRCEFPLTYFILSSLYLAKNLDDASLLLKVQQDKKLSFSHNFWRSLSAEPKLSFEAAYAMEDSIESIYLTLAQCAQTTKDGGTVSLDLSSLRARGSRVGGADNRSSGLVPVMKMLAETCEMLSGVKGDTQKARVYLKVWHIELEDFLAFGKTAPNSLRTSILINDSFMRRVFEGKPWLMGSAHLLPDLKLAKNGQDFELAMERYIEQYFGKDGLKDTVSLQKLAHIKLISARELMGMICQTIASDRGPSITFEDTLRPFDKNYRVLPSAKMGSLLPINSQDSESSVELGWAIDSQLPLDRQAELMGDVLRVVQGTSQRQFSLCLLGTVSPTSYLLFLEQLFKYWGKKWESSSFWGTTHCFETYKRFLSKNRGGYLDMGSKFDWKSEVGPLTGRLLAQSPREEFLWVTDAKPLWVMPENFSIQYRVGTKRVMIKQGVPEDWSETLRSAAVWQGLTDQCLTLDLFGLNRSAALVEESIKQAWVLGLKGIRRFVFK